MVEIRSMKLASALALALSVLGCSGSGGAHEEGAHAAHDAVPGSYEDWCGEHGVPESQCTRCNPSLIPAFQATGDWCGEHGLPESQCRICNPELRIERPARPSGS